MSPAHQEINGANGHSNGGLQFDTIEDSVNAFARGEFVIVLDDASRENEGDLICAAEDCTPEMMGFMLRYTSGYVCVPMTDERADQLELPHMVTKNRDPHLTAYTVTVDGLGPSTTTGISAFDRSCTVNMLADPTVTPSKLRRPGHVLPLRAKPGLTRERRGHTEAAVELCRLAGKQQVGVICEVVIHGEPVPGRAELSGSRMARRDDCLALGKQFGVKVCTIEDMTKYVEEREGKLQNQ
ncbi:3,4-dihydroxy-2-butanone 4-phosphate synthase [Microthyrium microscopicum]|uniref:3,4-dihydroxy-2-butanone 4-phosphate synthase n=1 Tax=Microthyrium microscopicum TaxID=703497 RepID=A0A6A6UT87_9PEZI|nr:3,4-dihydroxy-2-butanone 4-phosphate synthase [Microthyrium microscopicum]